MLFSKNFTFYTLIMKDHLCWLNILSQYPDLPLNLWKFQHLLCNLSIERHLNCSISLCFDLASFQSLALWWWLFVMFSINLAYCRQSMTKVVATSLKLEIRLHAHQVVTNTGSGTMVIFYEHLMAHPAGIMLLCTYSLISGLSNGAATLKHL